MGNSPYIIVANQQNFKTEVLDKSNQIPVLVDFWASWCAPCKMIEPILEKLVEEYQGQFILAKIDTDEQQQLAGQYSIRGIPALKLFRHGKVVEETSGVQSEDVLRKMIDKHRERPADKLRIQADLANVAGNYSEAIGLLQQAQELDPEYHPVTLELAKLLIKQKRFTEAELLIKKLPANIQVETEVNELKAYLTFSKIAAEAPSIEDLEIVLNSEPDNLMARYQLSAKKILIGEYEIAMQHLLEIMRKSRTFENDAGHNGLLALFTLLGNQGELVNNYRHKMSSLLY
ncbi:MAG TPA: thioredoxin [Thioploca sp.]|nr:thioredoxin [Thioploca sp.]